MLRVLKTRFLPLDAHGFMYDNRAETLFVSDLYTRACVQGLETKNILLSGGFKNVIP